MAMLCHLALLVLPVVAAVVIRFTVGKKDAFVRHHSSEAANAQLLFFVVWIGAAIYMMTSGVSQAAVSSTAVPWGLLIGWGIAMGDFLVSAIFCARAAIKAYRGVLYRYPQPIRLIPGALPRGSRL